MMTKEYAKNFLYAIAEDLGSTGYEFYTCKDGDRMRDAIKILDKEPRKGYWLRMSDLSEQEDDRYKCSCCGNVVHYNDKMNLYTFNSWCGRCGSDNGRDIEEELNEDRKKMWLKLYPIGAIYTGKYNPQGLFGGTWEQIKESVFVRRA